MGGWSCGQISIRSSQWECRSKRFDRNRQQSFPQRRRSSPAAAPLRRSNPEPARTYLARTMREDRTRPSDPSLRSIMMPRAPDRSPAAGGRRSAAGGSRGRDSSTQLGASSRNRPCRRIPAAKRRGRRRVARGARRRQNMAAEAGTARAGQAPNGICRAPRNEKPTGTRIPTGLKCQNCTPLRPSRRKLRFLLRTSGEWFRSQSPSHPRHAVEVDEFRLSPSPLRRRARRR